MPEAAFLCIDSTEFMRNGDYFPNRILAVQEATSLLCNAKMQQNQENTIGFLTLGGTACNVVETLTADIDRVVASLTQIPLSGKKTHFAHGLQIASLALTHLINSRSEKRIVVFVGSPITETPETLAKIAKKLRKDNVAVDIVSFGVESNIPIVQDFVEKVNKENNSRILVIPDGASVVECLMSSAIFLGNDAVAQGAAGGAVATGGVGGFDFGVDPSMDPELAMALRMSMEDERRRQELAVQASTAQPAAVQASTSAPAAAEVPQVVAAPSTAATEHRELSEEEELELALKLSEEMAEQEAKAAQAQPPAIDPEALEALDDEEFMKQLNASLDPTKKEKK